MLIKPSLETAITTKYEKHWIEDFEELEQSFKQDSPTVGVLDAETTGLHIKKDKPFMWVFGYLLPKNKQTESLKGKVFAFNHNPKFLNQVIQLSKKLKILFGHNIKYDLHMALNGNAEGIFELTNIMDTMGLCRLSFDAVSARDGGDKLGLKEVSKKYIDPLAEEFEKAVKKELKKINDEKRKVLINRLKPLGWGIGKLKDVYKVKKRGVIDIYTLEKNQRWVEVPKEVEETYKNWIIEYPPATYAEVDPIVMREYIFGDGIYTLELAARCYPIVMKRNQKQILEQENKLIIDLLAMERVGMRVDMEYLRSSFIKCDNEIQRLYEELWSIVGEYITVAQSKVIADYFMKELGIETATTDKKFLKRQKEHRVSQLITRLRRLEKWQSTYISRILEVAEYDGHFYTQYGQFNTVSGRLGSDAQQFPKERILTEQGEKYEDVHGVGSAPIEMEIFFPRRAFIPEGGIYKKIAYFDLSQIELRAQANYTLLLGEADVNLCRAYMPIYCKHYNTGEEYKFDTLENRARWNEKDENGNSAWLLENGEPWTPTDVHSETSHNTLLTLNYKCEEKYKNYTHVDAAPVDEKSFKKFWRYIGKMFNFMRNYGGGASKAAEALEIEMYIAEALVKGWSSTFPKVAHYQRKVSEVIQKKHYALNMYKRMYYLTDTDKAYKVGNYLVQGSCADMFKDFIIKINKFLRENNCKSKPLANIHDEIQFLIADGEEWIYPHIKQIMEDVEWMQVPVVVDLELTETSWAEKKEVHLERIC
ncbi:DNA polymerase [Paenibacillus xylaniclasticus]|uniref:DNA polymerase n=1 Tax=Paenibacillus xylaniclasticus TaxID=588083 RepID=UPI000FD7E2DE|nr:MULTISPECIES: DNA polymerase [Paenibacillus]GFN32391.1 hypothetical protein PCURB6_26510 [Paenibacillus curdlanolyticus]